MHKISSRSITKRHLEADFRELISAYCYTFIFFSIDLYHNVLATYHQFIYLPSNVISYIMAHNDLTLEVVSRYWASSISWKNCNIKTRHKPNQDSLLIPVRCPVKYTIFFIRLYRINLILGKQGAKP